MKVWQTRSGYKIIQLLKHRSNVFLLTDGKINILIDTSTKTEWLRFQIALKTLKITHIEYLILTHAHFDHVGNAYKIKHRYNPVVIIHKREASLLQEGKVVLGKGTNLITRFIVRFIGRKWIPRLKFDPCPYDVMVGSYYSLKEIGFNAYILHTPGHTSGSVSVIIDEQIALVGDTMFGVSRRSVYPPYANNPKVLIRSWKKLLSTHCNIFIPSHGTANTRRLLQRSYRRKKHKLHPFFNRHSRKNIDSSNDEE